MLLWRQWRHRAVGRPLSSQAMAASLDLTKEEAKLFTVLQFIRDEFAPDVTLRVAGGWVRDKLLGIPSDDIDIALDVGTGEEFAQHILSFQAASGVAPKGFYIVKKNTDASKHLACATVKLLGHDLDFVHLRSETYADPSSRIPTLSDTPASPTDDALRRDITINALFYNLSTRKIEDFTGQGLADLAAKCVRTPLPPLATFLDDPLRVLRAVRFACHYGFSLDAALLEAARDPRVQDALAKKVSRERVGIEVRKMLAGGAPQRAVAVLSELRLWPIVLPRLTPPGPAAVDAVAFAQAAVAPATWTLADKAPHDPTYMLAAALLNSAVDEAPGLGAALDALLHTPRCIVQHSQRRHGQRRDGALADVAFVASALAFIRHSPWTDHKFCMDAIKEDLKWSKAEAKAVADVLDAARSFVLGSDPTVQNTEQRYALLVLWFRAHGAQFDKVLPLLWYKTHGSEAAAAASLAEFRQAFATRALGQVSRATRTRLPATHLQLLLKKPVKKLAELIEILAAYETLHPECSIEDEERFVQHVLEPLYHQSR
ncbi:tRNA nucleotidyltransferase [Achlya hypogyna]|uniref:tRNA nucleotidyltransferase n=1 Tax=Achlya hypogyna TaxID=1202772 RepID=A0A1V9YEV1_ACHHY|nr:tRNA nucleotidyltransferase [Achlya hypogyna]